MLARPFASEELTAAELYRVDASGNAVSVIFGIGIFVPLALAMVTGVWWLGSRFAVVPVIGVLWVGIMIVRRLRKQPNILLMGLGAQEIVVLRASFLRGNWNVLDELGHWPASDLGATPEGTEVLGVELHPPGLAPLAVHPIAITHDASLISAALLR